MGTNTAPRNAVLTLASFAHRCNELAARALDVTDRNTDETDRDLMVQLDLLGGIADSSIFACESDFDDEAGLQQAKFAVEKANAASSFIRSGAAAVQRTMKVPSEEDTLFMRQRMVTNFRSNSPCCRHSFAQDADRNSREIIKHLTIPGHGSWSLHLVLFKCANLAQARRVLRAVGLQFTQLDPDTLRVGNEVIFVRK